MKTDKLRPIAVRAGQEISAPAPLRGALIPARRVFPAGTGGNPRLDVPGSAAPGESGPAPPAAVETAR